MAPRLGWGTLLAAATLAGCASATPTADSETYAVPTATPTTAAATTASSAPSTTAPTTAAPTTVLAYTVPTTSPPPGGGGGPTVAPSSPGPTLGPLPSGRYVIDPDDEVTLGDSGPGVLQIQDALVKSGYMVPLDGIFGLTTQTQVRAFQIASGLNVDGIVGPRTWAALSITLG